MKILRSNVLLFVFVYLFIYFCLHYVSQTPNITLQEKYENNLHEHGNHNIPDNYLSRDSVAIRFNQTNCEDVDYPAYFDIKFNNLYWQVLERKETLQ